MSEAPYQPAPRCWTEDEMSVGGLTLEPSERRHLEKVRRVRIGESVGVLNGRGQMGKAILLADGEVELREVKQHPEPSPKLSLYIGALKQRAWEDVLRHSTELGVSRIVRVESTHAVSKIEAKADKKRSRWRELLIEACKQSANPWIPELELASSVAEACSDPDLPEKGFVAQLGADASSLGQVLSDDLPESLAVWIGPEGDFTSTEYTSIRDAGMIPVTLGERVLRGETAALSLLSLLRLHH